LWRELKVRKGYDLNTIEDDVTLDKENDILYIPHRKLKWKCMKESAIQ
jgi:hypothetical protein